MGKAPAAAESESKPADAKKAPAKKRARRVHVPASERDISKDVVYLGGLAAAVTKEQLTEFLAPYGVQTITLRKAYRPRGAPRPRFAFVRVDTEANRDKMVADLEGKEYEGETLQAKKAFARLPAQTNEEAASPKENAEEKPKTPKKKKTNRKPRTRKPKSDATASPAKENSESAE